MIYGLIGEHLGHSFSPEIHAQIGPEPYTLRELAPDQLASFLAERDFDGINVTIPYKQAVMPYLDEISPTARAIGAVNTILRRDGRLLGDNTDAAGLARLIRRTGIEMAGQKVLILGTGGTSRTALYTARALGAAEALRVSRSAREGALTYEEAARLHSDAGVILNTTPCGMYPNAENQPIDLAAFPRLTGVIDAIYNPLRSRLVLSARARGIPAAGGLYMLAAQAVRAAELFRDTAYPDTLTEEIYQRLLRQKENIVLIGMPGCGKSAVGTALAERLGRTLADTDQAVAEQAGLPIPEIFARYGENRFRELESQAIAVLSARSGLVIATGGGAVLRVENVERLRRNGRLYWLDRPLEDLAATADRPLSDTREKLERLYRERRPAYQAAADEIIPVTGTPQDVARRIESR